MFTKEFDIAMPNEPMKNDFSGNAKNTGTFILGSIGLRACRFVLKPIFSA